MAATKPPGAPRTATQRAGSFLGWAFVISFVVHLLTVPFFHLKGRSQEKAEVEKVSVTKKIKVVVPTPPPPTPTPPPPTPPPKSTPPPVKQTNPPPQPKLKVNPPKTAAVSGTHSEAKYVPPPKGTEEGVPQGTTASAAPPAKVSTAPPATPAPAPTPTVAPTIPPTPKPVCAVPNADASIRGSAVDPDYPDIARQQGAVGTTQVKVTLDAVGGVTDASVYKSAGNASLDQAAVKAARATAYTPEIVNCVKTAGSYIFRADFTGQ